MAFEPLGFGQRWFDRLAVGIVSLGTFSVVLIVVAATIVINELF